MLHFTATNVSKHNKKNMLWLQANLYKYYHWLPVDPKCWFVGLNTTSLDELLKCYESVLDQTTKG